MLCAVAVGRYYWMPLKLSQAFKFKPKTSYGYDELLECAHGRLFGPGNARLPLPPMLMFDRITSIRRDGGKHGQGEILAELDIRPDLWFFGAISNLIL